MQSSKTTTSLTFPTRLLAVVSVMSVGLLASCTMQYNGAWGLDGEDQAAIAAAGASKSPAPQRPATAPDPAPQAMTSSRSPARFMDRQRPAPGGATVMTVAAPIPGSEGAVPAGPRSSRPLGLFGDLPKSSGPARSSPLDSPDNVQRVTFASEAADFDPEIDPSGALLVYSSTQHRKNSDIYVKNINGTSVTQLTDDPAEDMMPTFSPDGGKIAYCSNRTGNWDIYLMDASGGQAVQITNDSADDIHPSFSPDGKRLVYCSFGAQSGQWELVVIDVDHPSAKKFIGTGLFPRWCPTADRIVFQRARERGTHWFSIWTLDLVNGEGVRPTEVVASSNAAAITPSWSPDGRSIVFCTVMDPTADMNKSPTQADVWVVNADGSGRSNLTQNPFANLQPAWSKDGAIYFASNRGPAAIENVWCIRPDRAVRVARNEASNMPGEPTRTAAVEKPAAPMTGAKAIPAPAAQAPAMMAKEPIAHGPAPMNVVEKTQAAEPAPEPVAEAKPAAAPAPAEHAEGAPAVADKAMTPPAATVTEHDEHHGANSSAAVETHHGE